MKAASFPWCQRIAFVETGYQTTASSFDRSQKRWWVKEYKVLICFYPLHPSIKWKESMPYLSYIILNFVDHHFGDFRWTYQNSDALFAKARSVEDIPCTRSLSTKLGKLVFTLKVSLACGSIEETVLHAVKCFHLSVAVEEAILIDS